MNSGLNNPVINTPNSPSFGGAVKWAWSRTTVDIVLHLEDDWTLLNTIKPKMVEDCFRYASEVKNIKLSRRVKMESADGSSETKFREKEKQRILPDGTIKTYHIPSFGTSPRFMDGNFSRSVASLMNPEFDPEKQMKKNITLILL